MAMRYYGPLPGQDREPFKAATAHVRIGHAERDAAAAELGDHFVAGRLSLDELHERLGEVFAAKTYGQLNRIMSDLPGPRGPSSEPGPRRLAHAAWAAASWPPATLPPALGDRRNNTPSDRAARIAAVSLIIMAMLIWLFTALLFARHGFPQNPYGGFPGGKLGPGIGP